MAVMHPTRWFDGVVSNVAFGATAALWRASLVGQVSAESSRRPAGSNG
jgi:hypothetical protein